MKYASRAKLYIINPGGSTETLYFYQISLTYAFWLNPTKLSGRLLHVNAYQLLYQQLIINRKICKTPMPVVIHTTLYFSLYLLNVFSNFLRCESRSCLRPIQKAININGNISSAGHHNSCFSIIKLLPLPLELL